MAQETTRRAARRAAALHPSDARADPVRASAESEVDVNDADGNRTGGAASLPRLRACNRFMWFCHYSTEAKKALCGPPYLSFARRNNIMAQTVADAAPWVSAEAMPVATRVAPMDSTTPWQPAHAFTRPPELIPVHSSMHAILLQNKQHSMEEFQMGCEVGEGGRGGHELDFEQYRQQQQQRQQVQHLQQQQQATQQQQQQQMQQQQQYGQQQWWRWQWQQQQQQRRCQCSTDCALLPTLISPSHGAMCAQRLRGGGGGSSDDSSDDEQVTPDARRAAPVEPGTPVRAAKRRLDASELVQASEEAEQWQAFEEADKEARRWETAQKIERRSARQRRRAWRQRWPGARR